MVVGSGGRCTFSTGKNNGSEFGEWFSESCVRSVISTSG